MSGEISSDSWLANMNGQIERAEKDRLKRERRAARRMSMSIKPVHKALEKDGSLGIAVLSGGSKQRFMDALTAYAGSDDDIYPIPAQGNIQGAPIDDAAAMNTIRGLEAFSHAKGPTGIIVIDGVKPVSHGAEKGHPEVYEYLSNIALETRLQPMASRVSPSIVGIGHVTPGEQTLLQTAYEGRGRNVGSGFTFMLNDHYTLDSDGSLRSYEIRFVSPNFNAGSDYKPDPSDQPVLGIAENHPGYTRL